MAQTALEKIAELNKKEEEAIAALKAKNAEQVAALKAEALHELTKKIRENKLEGEALAAEYAALTGKTLKGEKAGGVRVRLSPEAKAALVEKVVGIVKAGKGLSFGEISSQAGATESAARDAVKKAKEIKRIVQKGDKATARYFAK